MKRDPLPRSVRLAKWAMDTREMINSIGNDYLNGDVRRDMEYDPPLIPEEKIGLLKTLRGTSSVDY